MQIYFNPYIMDNFLQLYLNLININSNFSIKFQYSFFLNHKNLFIFDKLKYRTSKISLNNQKRVLKKIRRKENTTVLVLKQQCMNPHSFNNFYPGIQFNQRDKIKSYVQPILQNQFVASLNGNSFINNSSGIYQSQKYKNYYNQYQDYKQLPTAQLENNFSPENQKSLQKKSSLFLHDKFSSTNPVSFYPAREIKQEKSLQRKRFYTVSNKQQSSHILQNQYSSQFQQSSSNSMIFKNNNFELEKNSNNQNLINPKKDLFKFVNQKFAASRVQSNFDSREKKSQLNQEKSEYLQKANKKISLKRDLVLNNSKYRQFDKKSQNFKNLNQNEIQDRSKAISFFQSTLKQSKNENIDKLQYQIEQFPSSNGQLSQNNCKQISFKKSKVGTYQNVSDLGSSQLSSSTGIISPSTSRNTDQCLFGSIKSNKISNKLSAKQGIDSQIFTDMKISRIQESTSNLQQKLQKLVKNLQVLSHHSKQHQISLNQINQYIGKQQQEGITPHDIKRIKKQLKIMKTNFQTAFTSMTDQINRKLIKQQNIMKNLSEQIRVVAEQNKKLNQTLYQKSQKMDNLDKSMTSFMRQNEQRMQNLVLNDSFSSSKRSRNHSFEYGLDLKNMSGQQNLSMGKHQQNFDNINRKIQLIEREIKKMKIFHIEEQQLYRTKFSEVNEKLEQQRKQQQMKLGQNQIKSMVLQISQSVLQIKLQNMSQKISERQDKKISFLMDQIEMFKSKIDEFHKICHEQLYQFRMNKFDKLNGNIFEVNANKAEIINPKYQQQLSQMQNKQRSFLITLTQFQQKLISLQDRQHSIWKNLQDNRLKQLKMSGDTRDINSALKQFRQQLSQIKIFKQKTEVQNKQSANSINSILFSLNLLAEIEFKLKQFDRINIIQTQNIESINNQFERVINKEIIPKFGEIHCFNQDLNFKFSNLSSEVNMLKKVQSKFTDTKINKTVEIRDINQQIQNYFQTKIRQFLEKKVKVVSARPLISTQPVSKIGIFHKKCQLEYSLEQEDVRKQETYLIDQNNYLMDWSGCYLMETDQDGIRKRIKVTLEQIYFMEVNGIQIKRN